MCKKISFYICFVLMLWLCALCLFIFDVISFNGRPYVICDNVVVLTGGQNRIIHALKTIHANIPQNIFISGVYEKSRLRDIIGDVEVDNNVNFILGKKAKNTRENAIEVNQWTVENEITRILLVTSDYHMRRAIFALKNVNSALRVIPYSYKSQYNIRFVVNCIKEMHKIIYMWVENIFIIEKEKQCL